MCLTRIDREEVLAEDLKVWKSVFIDDGGEIPVLNYISRKTKVREFTVYLDRIEPISYIPHFHCYINHQKIKIEDMRFLKCLEYIVPKGTKVLFGKQGDAEVVVTPVLINPRVV